MLVLKIKQDSEDEEDEEEDKSGSDFLDTSKQLQGSLPVGRNDSTLQ
jgi:hypothetical protein